MNTALALTQTLAHLSLTEATPAGRASGVHALTLFLVIATGLALIWALRRLRQVSKHMQQTRQQAEAGAELAKTWRARAETLEKTADRLRDEILELKKEVATQRKKNHAAQEELKGVRAQWRDEIRQLEDQLKHRPAFTEAASRATQVASEQTTTTAPKPQQPIKQLTPATPASQPKARPAQQAPSSSEEQAPAENAAAWAADKAALDETRARLLRAQADSRALQQQLSGEQSLAQEQKVELKQMRQRLEQARRIEMITKGKMEVLEDKLRTLGRQYYESVSQLALLKGEVRPLARDVRRLDTPPARADGQTLSPPLSEDLSLRQKTDAAPAAAADAWVEATDEDVMEFGFQTPRRVSSQD